MTAEQLDQTVFAPDLTEVDTQATLRYYPIGEALESETTLSLGIRGKENKPPEARDSSLETYKNIPNTGKLLAKDPEGEALTYTVTRQPRRGSVEIGAEGSFTYTPKNNKVGVDSFAYTASDPGGKTSREATVTITILRPTEPNDYADTEGTDCCFFAQWMRSTGIFSGENLAGELCFQPEKKVTRGELLTMVVKTLGIPLEEDPEPQTLSAYPKWLRPYAAAALRYGLADRGIWQTEDWDSETPASHQEAAEHNKAGVYDSCFVIKLRRSLLKYTTTATERQQSESTVSKMHLAPSLAQKVQDRSLAKSHKLLTSTP